MNVPIKYENDPNYPLLERVYGRKQAIKILQSGVPINRPGVIPSLQVPSATGGCDGFPQLDLDAKGLNGLGTMWDFGRKGPCDASPDWCNWVPFADYADDCRPIDPIACSAPGPGMTPVNRNKARADGDTNVAGYCAANPDMCAAYSDYKANEYWYEYAPWLAAAGGVLVLALLVRR